MDKNHERGTKWERKKEKRRKKGEEEESDLYK